MCMASETQIRSMCLFFLCSAESLKPVMWLRAAPALHPDKDFLGKVVWIWWEKNTGGTQSYVCSYFKINSHKRSIHERSKHQSQILQEENIPAGHSLWHWSSEFRKRVWMKWKHKKSNVYSACCPVCGFAAGDIYPASKLKASAESLCEYTHLLLQIWTVVKCNGRPMSFCCLVFYHSFIIITACFLSVEENKASFKSWGDAGSGNNNRLYANAVRSEWGQRHLPALFIIPQECIHIIYKSDGVEKLRCKQSVS